ncbi:TPA: hypothetical protein QDB06_000841 [Burkholderia vietnamiensis]|nr:hypothetical protein [Burkholderia vietnamiensis]
MHTKNEQLKKRQRELKKHQQLKKERALRDTLEQLRARNLPIGYASIAHIEGGSRQGARSRYIALEGMIEQTKKEVRLEHDLELLEPLAGVQTEDYHCVELMEIANTDLTFHQFYQLLKRNNIPFKPGKNSFHEFTSPANR